MDFAVPADHRIKLKESEKKDKYLNFARELKKLLNMQVTILPIVIDASGTDLVWFLLFNGISTSVGYLMPKPFSEKNSSATILPIARRIRVSYLSQGYLSESECNSAIGVRTRVLRFHSPSLYPVHHKDTPASGTVTKGLVKGLEDLEVGRRVETIQTTALLRTAKILGRVLETWGDLLSLKRQWKTIS